MLKVYIPIWETDPHRSLNPYVHTLTDELGKEHDVMFYYGMDLLWNKECEDMDIMHIMWPDFFSFAMLGGKDLKARLIELKNKGIKLVCTCHNLHAHIKENLYSDETYSICYENSDIIIHLGEYSRLITKEKYTEAQHVVIPHHVYDKLYGNRPPRNESLVHLGLNGRYSYILCMGKFRTDEEVNLVKDIAEQTKGEGFRILAPTMFRKPTGHKNPLTWWKYYTNIAKCRKKGIIAGGIHVTDQDLPYYYGVSDISLIQRTEILNSGNVPLGMFMGNVVVGPKTGNVGEILEATGNPTFLAKSSESTIRAIKAGLLLQGKGKGEENKRYCNRNCTTEMIAEQHWNIYSNLINNG